MEKKDLKHSKSNKYLTFYNLLDDYKKINRMILKLEILMKVVMEKHWKWISRVRMASKLWKKF
jgi:hypothetical protein